MPAWACRSSGPWSSRNLAVSLPSRPGRAVAPRSGWACRSRPLWPPLPARRNPVPGIRAAAKMGPPPAGSGWLNRIRIRPFAEWLVRKFPHATRAMRREFFPARLAWCRSGVGASPDPAEPPLVGAPFVLAHAAPHARVLPALDRPLQAAFGHRATAADLLGLVDLEQRRARVSDREEQFRVHLTAGSVVAPVHAVHSSMTAGLTARIRYAPLRL